VVREAVVPPYTLFRLADPGPGYVEPLAFEPVRSSPSRWRDQAFHWFSRKPPNRAVIVFTDDPRFPLAAADAWAPPPERPLPGGVEVTSRLEPEEIRITTSRPGHPLLVKVSYHPRWRAVGADGPYLVSPGFMLLVPRQGDVRLTYAARTWSDWLGLGLAAGALAAWATAAWRRRPRTAEATTEGPPRRGSRRLALLPIGLVVALSALRLLPPPSRSGEIDAADGLASRAYAEERWEDAAEYARHAVDLLPPRDPRRAGLLCVRGEALLRAGHPREAIEPFALVAEGEAGPLQPQALHSGALAREAAGDVVGAAEWRRRLVAEYPQTPWAQR
jgi:hypothetical protein